MAKPDIIVVGASAGGVEAIKDLITCLPSTFSGSVFIVLHIPPYSPSALPEILSKCNTFNAIHPKDEQKIQPKTIYIAPPDHHLIIEKDRVLVRKGPKENRFRPSIDALFRSAAYSYGPRVMGIVLSGALDDGTSGMWTVKRLNGTTIIQDPAEAMFPEMPLHVKQYIDVDYCQPVAGICNIIELLMSRPVKKKAALSAKKLKLLKTEIIVSKQDNAFSMDIINQGTATSFTCPECHGALAKMEEEKILRFRCHTGHAFTASALLAGITETIENSLWNTMRAMEESAMLLENLKHNFRQTGDNKATAFFEKAEQMHRKRAQVLHKSIFAENTLSADMRFTDKNAYGPTLSKNRRIKKHK